MLHQLNGIHEAGISAADIKPSNFLVSKDKISAKFVDFGNSRLIGSEIHKEEIPFYGFLKILPEGENTLSPKSDIYSLGKNVMLSLFKEEIAIIRNQSSQNAENLSPEDIAVCKEIVSLIQKS